MASNSCGIVVFVNHQMFVIQNMYFEKSFPRFVGGIFKTLMWQIEPKNFRLYGGINFHTLKNIDFMKIFAIRRKKDQQ